MKILFYNIASILLGLLLIYYAIVTIVKNKKTLFGSLSLGVAALFIGFGIFGFVLPEEYGNYSFIVVLGMLLCTIIEILLFLTLNKKEPVKRNGNKDVKKKEPKEEAKEETEEVVAIEESKEE